MIVQEVDARKSVLQDEAAWKLFAQAKLVRVAKGKKVLEYVRPGESVRDELLAAALGRTGNLRAPTLRQGTTCYVGYNEALYEELTV